MARLILICATLVMSCDHNRRFVAALSPREMPGSTAGSEPRTVDWFLKRVVDATGIEPVTPSV